MSNLPPLFPVLELCACPALITSTLMTLDMKALLVLCGVLARASCLRIERSTTRRSAVGAAVGLGVASLAHAPLAAVAKNRAAEFASGFELTRSVDELTAEAQADVWKPFVAAWKLGDASAVSALFTADATVVDCHGKNKKILVGATEIGSYFAASPASAATRVTLRSLVPESEYDGSATKVLHTQYLLATEGGALADGYARLVKAKGEPKWQFDRQLYPLQSGKASAMLQPKRDVLGRVYMEMKLPT